jgi:hypothetical protein
MKKVYFACAIRGGRDDAALYGQLVEATQAKGSAAHRDFC